MRTQPQPPWIPDGYAEEEREWLILLLPMIRFGMPILRLFPPETSHELSVWMLEHWPRIKYHVLVKATA